jgi:hypothetical protein
MTKFKDKFNALYNGSSTRTLTLQKVQKLLEEPELTIKEPHSIRWLGLKYAVEAVYESYNSVVATLSQFAAEKDPVAKGLYKYFRNYKVALVTAFMLDVHSELTVSSCNLQKRNMLFSELKPSIEGTVDTLESMVHTDGEGLKSMKARVCVEDGKASIGGEELAHSRDMDQQFLTLREKYIKNLTKNVKARFREDDSILFTDMSRVMEPFTLNSVSSTESDDSLAHLADRYGTEKNVCILEGEPLVELTEHRRVIEPLLDKDKLKQEWPRLKGMMQGAYSELQTQQVCKRVILLHMDTMPNCATLADIALCMQSYNPHDAIKHWLRKKEEEGTASKLLPAQGSQSS